MVVNFHKVLKYKPDCVDNKFGDAVIKINGNQKKAKKAR